MEALHFSKKQQFNSGFLAGLMAGILASGIMVLLSLLAGGVSLPEALGSAIAQAMPLPVFDYLHRTIGGEAKYYLLFIILLGQCLVFAVSGGLWNLALGVKRFSGWHDKRGQWHWSAGFVLAFCLLLFSGCIFLPLTGAGFFGSQLGIGPFNTIVSLTIVGASFGLLYIIIQNWLALRHVQKYATVESAAVSDAGREETVQKRRSLIRQGLTVLGLGTLGVIAWRFITGTGSVTSTPKAVLDNYQSKIIP